MLRRVPCVRRTETRGDLPPRSCRRRPDDRATDTPIYTAPGMHRIDTVEADRCADQQRPTNTCGHLALAPLGGPVQQAPIHRPIQHSTWLSAPPPGGPQAQSRRSDSPRGWRGVAVRGQLPSHPVGGPLKRQTARSCVDRQGGLLPVRCCHRPPPLRKDLLGPTAIDRSIQRPIHLATQLSARP
jgi:hypothetical protein